MPSQISKTLESYKEALDVSRERYEKLKSERFKNTIQFYNLFFNNLIKRYDKRSFNNVKMLAEQFFQVDKVRFAAVDGSCYKKQLQDYMVFFGAAYPVRGIIDFSRSDKKFIYEPWSPEEDVSMVAYIPVPFTELSDTIEDPFVISDDQKIIDLSNIHIQLMELAEVFQAYMLIKSSDLRPKILLWDQSMSGVMNSNEVSYERINLIGYKYQMRALSPQDIIIAYSHPYNKELGVPSKKKYHIMNYVLQKLQEKSPQSISALVNELNLSKEELINRINYLTNSNLGETSVLKQFEPLVEIKDDNLYFNKNYEGSWEWCIGLFEHICKKLFKEKKPNALIYEKAIENIIEEKWTSPNDLKFLISIGIRALIEECWKYDVLLIGIVKDSTSKYLTRNYLGVMENIGIYPNIPHVPLPWSDRELLETLPWIDDSLNAPWSTIEFDSVFMTLHLEKDKNGDKKITGVRGNIVAPSENLFTRSLAQFYLNRNKPSLVYGHVIFIDRLLIPKLDKNVNHITINQNPSILGTIKPVFFSNNQENNYVQDLMMFVLDILTRNLYPEVIGYPDPLQKADWGAKSLYKKIKPIIDSSDISLRTIPTHKTFRQLRNEIKRI